MNRVGGMVACSNCWVALHACSDQCARNGLEQVSSTSCSTWPGYGSNVTHGLIVETVSVVDLWPVLEQAVLGTLHGTDRM